MNSQYTLNYRVMYYDTDAGGVLEEGVKAEIEKHGLTLFGVLPHDEAVYRCDCNGEPSAKLPESDPMKTALKGIMAEIGL